MTRYIQIVATLTVAMGFAFCLAGCQPQEPPHPSGSNTTTAGDRTSLEKANQDLSVQVSQYVSYVLEDGEQIHAENPESFWIPPLEVRSHLQPGTLVKLMFRITTQDEVQTERMWVIVGHATSDGFIGTLDNDPYITNEIKAGLEVHFQPRHVIQIYEEDEESP